MVSHIVETRTVSTSTKATPSEHQHHHQAVEEGVGVEAVPHNCSHLREHLVAGVHRAEDMGLVAHLEVTADEPLSIHVGRVEHRVLVADMSGGEDVEGMAQISQTALSMCVVKVAAVVEVPLDTASVEGEDRTLLAKEEEADENMVLFAAEVVEQDRRVVDGKTLDCLDRQ